LEKVITNNASEVISIKWDGERFALTHIRKSLVEKELTVKDIIILNPREMLDLVIFAGSLGKER